MLDVEVRASRHVVGREMDKRDFSDDVVGDEKGDGDDVGVVRGGHFKVCSGFKGGDGEDEFVVLLRILWSIVVGKANGDLLGGGVRNVDASAVGSPLEELGNEAGVVHF